MGLPPKLINVCFETNVVTSVLLVSIAKFVQGVFHCPLLRMAPSVVNTFERN